MAILVTNDTRLVLTNAISFKADWRQAFAPELTEDRPFTLPTGGQVTVPMMSRGFSRPLVGCLAGWLGREDSNLCISNWCPAVFSAVVPCGEGRSCTRLLESIGRHPCRRTVA